MARAIGVDIGDRLLKVVELSGSARSFRVQRIAIREIPGSENGHHEDDGSTELTDDLVIEESGELTHVDETDEPELTRSEQISQLIAEVFREMKLPKEDVCASFPAHTSVNREIQVPFFEDDQIRKVVRFEAENHLHSHSIDDVVVNWIKTGETKDGSRLTIFASPKQDLAERIAQLRRARVDPAAIDLDATALYTTLEATGLVEQNPNCIVVDVGASSSTLIMLVDGRPRVMRSFRLGIGSLEEEVGRELGVAVGEGQSEMRRLTGDSDDLLVPASELATPESDTDKSLTQLQTDVVTDSRTMFVTKLHREAVRSLASVSTDSPPDKLLLLGGGSTVPGVAHALSERFGLPAEPVDLLEHLDCKDKGSDPELTGAAIGTAVGCGLRMLGRNPFGIELLQEEFAPRNVFEVIRTTLATAITLLFIVIGVWTYGIKEELKAERVKYNDMAAVVELMTFKAELAYLQGIGDPPGNVKTKDVAEKMARNKVRGLARDEKRINRMRALLTQRHRFLQDRLGLRSDIPQLPSAVKCMYEIYTALSAVPREQLGTFFQIQEMIIQERRATVKIVVDNRTVFDTVRRLFSQSPYFKDRAADPTKVVEPGAEQTVEGRFRQNFTFKFRDE
ncbi:MAG: pilus assembly protein PilM [Planctomycetota bacterium]|nr:pilus assembly protein PilM [Planctomycetota bacterium]